MYVAALIGYNYTSMLSDKDYYKLTTTSVYSLLIGDECIPFIRSRIQGRMYK